MAEIKTDDEKVSNTLQKIMKLLNKDRLTIPELILLYGNLGYHIGASIAGFKEDGPSLEELKKEYYSNPTIDVGFMLQALLIGSWEQDFIKQPKLSKFYYDNQKNKKEEKK